MTRALQLVVNNQPRLLASRRYSPPTERWLDAVHDDIHRRMEFDSQRGWLDKRALRGIIVNRHGPRPPELARISWYAIFDYVRPATVGVQRRRTEPEDRWYSVRIWPEGPGNAVQPRRGRTRPRSRLDDLPDSATITLSVREYKKRVRR